MFPAWVTLGLLLGYVVAFLAVARVGERFFARPQAPWTRTIVYALSSCVLFGVWSSFGAVGAASRRGLNFLPLFLGPIIIFGLFHPVLARMIRIARAQKITSIADFVAVRYDRSIPVAATVTGIALLSCIPFIALQLKAVAEALALASGGALPWGSGRAGFMGAVVLVGAVVALLAVLVGSPRGDPNERQGGLPTALAAESVVRLVSVVGVGVFVCWGLFGGIGDLTNRVTGDPHLASIVDAPPSLARWLPIVLVTMGATLVMPRQFHVSVVENRDEGDVRTAAWIVPAVLAVLALFVMPIAAAGLVSLPPGSVDVDFTVLALPMQSGHGVVVLVALVGCFAASLGTAVVSATAVSVMICNDLAIPLLLSSGRRGQQRTILSPPVRLIRRTAIAVIGVVAAVIAILLADDAADRTAFRSIVLGAQIAPAALGAMIWSRGTARGAIGGMLAGSAVCAYTLLLPMILPQGSPLLTMGPLGFDKLRPTDLLGTELAPVQQGVVWSLTANVVAYVVLSLSRAPTTGERLLANVFVRAKTMAQATSFRLRHANVSVGELLMTVSRFLGRDTAERLFAEHHAGRGLAFDPTPAAEPLLLQYAERLIATTIGASSARLVISLLLEQKELSRDAARRIIDDVAFEIQSSRDLLQHAIDIARDGMAIFDADLRLVAWNRAYRDMFQLPPAVLRPGTPLEDMIRSNADRGIYGRDADAEDFVAARLDVLAQPTLGLRMLNAPIGRVLEMNSVRLHNGGIFFTYSDATAQVQSEEELEAENETLELRVRERTDQLEQLNIELARAKAEAENAYITKSRFLAAASHDVLQPLSAARLYAASLRERLRRLDSGEAIALAENVDHSLEAVEDVLGALLEISQLDAKATKTEITTFALQPLFNELRIDFEPLARGKQLGLTFVTTSIAVRSDRRLLRRLLQNLVSNALKYTRQGHVLVGLRRAGRRVRIEVLDTGLGIPEAKLQLIFREFERLPSGAQAATGAGLGLSIVERLSHVLEHEITVRSQLGRGSVFAVALPVAVGVAPEAAAPVVPSTRQGILEGLVVAAIDNETHILAGLETLLRGWGCAVACGTDLVDVEAALARQQTAPDAIVADYHIGDIDGLGVIAALRKRYGPCPAVLVTADRSPEVRELAARDDVRIVHKPLKPATLRALLSQWRLLKPAAE